MGLVCFLAHSTKYWVWNEVLIFSLTFVTGGKVELIKLSHSPWNEIALQKANAWFPRNCRNKSRARVPLEQVKPKQQTDPGNEKVNLGSDRRTALDVT